MNRRWAASMLLALGCSGGDGEHTLPLFDPDAIEGELVEVVSCKHSHEHELRHVRILADTTSAELFQRCVLSSLEPCTETGFPAGSLFVKLEYEYAGCNPHDLAGYTAALRGEDGSYPEGLDWRWQRTTTDLEVLEDGAPSSCITCHTDHCSWPDGFDSRCAPD